MTKFDDATRVVRVDETTYDVSLDGGYAIGGRLNGGYLLAVLARAAVDASPHEHPVATNAQYLRSVLPGPAVVRLTPLKTGRTTAVTRATLLSDGTPLVESLITTATLDGAPPVWSDDPAEPMPSLDDCLPLPPPRPEWGMTLSAQTDLRFDPPTIGWTKGETTGRPELRAYFRMSEPQDPDPYLLALALDSMPPVVFSALGVGGWAPTVELTWHLRALPVPGWLTLRAKGHLVRDGWFDEEVEARDQRGHLVAHSRQLARLGRP